MTNKSNEGFTVSMALVDALPVIFFSISTIIIAVNFKNILFLTGAIISALAGLVKVLWKLIFAISNKNILIMNKQMRVFMPLGFLLIIISVIFNAKAIDWQMLWSRITSFPSILFFIVGIVGMVTMIVLAVKLDPTKPKSNWIEQTVNTIAQGFILLGIIFI